PARLGARQALSDVLPRPSAGSRRSPHETQTGEAHRAQQGARTPRAGSLPRSSGAAFLEIFQAVDRRRQARGATISLRPRRGCPPQGFRGALEGCQTRPKAAIAFVGILRWCLAFFERQAPRPALL